MYSNITEAWGHDPVKEMTDKLSRGAFSTQTERSDIFNFKNQSNYLNDKKVISKQTMPQRDVLSLSDIVTKSPMDNSLSILSENTLDSDYSNFAPVNFNKYSIKPAKKNNRKHLQNSFRSLALSDNSSDNMFDSPADLSDNDSRCTYSIRHLKKCDRCYYKLKRLIDSKVGKKFDEMVLDNKMKQLQNSTQPTIIQSVPHQNNGISDSWKETLIIVIGTIIAFLIIFLIVRSLNK